MSMYIFKKYGDNYSKASGSLWHYYRDESFLANGAITDSLASNNDSALV